MPSTFGPDYVENVVAPYILSNRYTGDQPVLPMLDLISVAVNDGHLGIAV